MEAELFDADGWTDMTKLLVVFRNFANAPKRWEGGECNYDTLHLFFSYAIILQDLLVLSKHPSLKYVVNSIESQNVSGKGALSIRALTYQKNFVYASKDFENKTEKKQRSCIRKGLECYCSSWCILVENSKVIMFLTY
jgi:hypothetical protein